MYTSYSMYTNYLIRVLIFLHFFYSKLAAVENESFLYLVCHFFQISTLFFFACVCVYLYIHRMHVYNFLSVDTYIYIDTHLLLSS